MTILYDITYMCNLKKMIQMNLFITQTYSYQMGKEGG